MVFAMHLNGDLFVPCYFIFTISHYQTKNTFLLTMHIDFKCKYCNKGRTRGRPEDYGSKLGSDRISDHGSKTSGFMIFDFLNSKLVRSSIKNQSSPRIFRRVHFFPPFLLQILHQHNNFNSIRFLHAFLHVTLYM
jgi:hypothetical protein